MFYYFHLSKLMCALICSNPIAEILIYQANKMNKIWPHEIQLKTIN